MLCRNFDNNVPTERKVIIKLPTFLKSVFFNDFDGGTDIFAQVAHVEHQYHASVVCPATSLCGISSSILFDAVFKTLHVLLITPGDKNKSTTIIHHRDGKYGVHHSIDTLLLYARFHRHAKPYAYGVRIIMS